MKTKKTKEQTKATRTLESENEGSCAAQEGICSASPTGGGGGGLQMEERPKVTGVQHFLQDTNPDVGFIGDKCSQEKNHRRDRDKEKRGRSQSPFTSCKTEPVSEINSCSLNSASVSAASVHTTQCKLSFKRVT